MFFFQILNRVLNIHRFISAVVFVFIFFLPLHYHPVTASLEVSQECGCVQVSRTGWGLVPPPVILSPRLEVSFVVPAKTITPVSLVVETEFARAPPSSI